MSFVSKITKNNPNTLFLLLIIFLSFLTRILFLNRVPSGINDDEVHFVMNAKSFLLTQKSIDGKHSALKLGELSSLIFAPIIGILPTNLFTARLPYALIGTLVPLLIYLLINKLTKNKVLSIVSALIVSINPWNIYVSRTSFDAPIAIFFLLLTIYLLSFNKSKLILLSSLTSLIAFNSYIATKIIYFPIILFSSYYMWIHKRKTDTVAHLIVVLFSLLVTLNFIVSLPKQLVAGRVSEISSPFSQQIKDQVNQERRLSTRRSPLNPILTNKYTVFTKKFIQKYLYNFSTDILFINGDHATTGSLWKHGYFYYIDALLIILGIIFLYKSYPKLLLFLSFLILISPFPEAIRSDAIPSYVFHSSLQFPIICIIIAAGILFLWNLLKNKYIKRIFIIIYTISFINFIDIYFLKSPVYQPESFRFSQRILSKYLQIESNKKEIYVLTRQPEFTFRSYLFYTNQYNQTNLKKIQNIYQNSFDNITYKNIHFINQQSDLPKNKKYTLIYDSINYVFNTDDSIYISKLSDAGDIYTIKNGQTCQNQPLQNYPNNISFANLNTDKLSQKDFCQKFITKK